MIDDPFSGKRLLTRKRVLELTALSSATLHRKIEAGTFPRALPISTNRVAWREADVLSWLENPT